MTSIFNNAISHPIGGGTLHVPFGAADGVWSAQKVETCKRLIRAYKTTVSQDGNWLKAITDADLWSSITRDNFGEMMVLVESDNAEQLSHFLTHFGREYTWFGGITTGVDGYNHWDRDEQSVAFSYFDKLVCLGEALGVLSAENPEQGEAGNWGRNIRHTPDFVVDAISEYLGISLCPPMGVIPVAGVQTAHGLVHYRHINSLYLASRIRDLTTDGDRVGEFGAGLGLVAYYLTKMGRSDITLFDIPITNILSGFFLIGALSPDAVCLEGENMNDEAIKVRANWNCVSVPEKYFKLMANQDSFPEINERIFDAYIEQISRITTDYFLSINHEVEHPIDGAKKHLNVSKMLSLDNRLKRISRFPYWIRRGYVEELYRLSATPHHGSFRLAQSVGT